MCERIRSKEEFESVIGNIFVILSIKETRK